jgi:thiazole synthase ThiGH ThiG subunit
MKPTPLGKTYLEYQAELKEYNLAKTELAMQKIELGVVQDAIKNVEAAEKLFEEGFLVVSFARTKAIPMIKNSITNAKKFLAQFEQTKKRQKN